MTDWLKRTAPGIAGLHPYIPGKPLDELERELGLTDTIKLASNENPLGCSDRVGEVLADGLSGDEAREAVVGPEERNLAGPLVDIDGHGRQVAVGRTDLRRDGLVELEVDDAIDFLDHHLLRARERLGVVEHQAGAPA